MLLTLITQEVRPIAGLSAVYPSQYDLISQTQGSILYRKRNQDQALQECRELTLTLTLRHRFQYFNPLMTTFFFWGGKGDKDLTFFLKFQNQHNNNSYVFIQDLINPESDWGEFSGRVKTYEKMLDKMSQNDAQKKKKSKMKKKAARDKANRVTTKIQSIKRVTSTLN